MKLTALTLQLKASARQKTLVLAAVASLGAGQAQAQDLGQIMGGLNSILGMLGGGNLMGLVSMIPGLNFLAGLGPIMDIVKMIPGLDGLLSSIPGLNQILGLLGMGGGNLGPLTNQINDAGKWLKSSQDLYGNIQENVVKQGNYEDMTREINSLLQMTGTKTRLDVEEFKRNPLYAAQAAMAGLSEQQSNILQQIAHSQSNAETNALRTQAQILEVAKGRAQRTADGALALQDTQALAKRALERTESTLNYSKEAAQSLKDNKKIEDIAKISGSATLELLRLTANDSALLTSALANQLKVQVAQAQSLGHMVDMMQTDRMEKAVAISNTLELERKQYEAAMAGETNKAKQLAGGFGGLFKPGAAPLGGN